MNSRIASLSSNALLAKARAMYADVLTRENYTELSACHTVSEAASYLKAHTAYGEALSELSAAKLHRARLEAALRQYMLGKMADLFAFEKALGQELNGIFAMRSDIDYILLCADYLDTDSIGEYMLITPTFFRQNSEIDAPALERALSAGELCEALRHTRYWPLVEPFTNGQTPFSVQALENSLYGYLYAQAEKTVSASFKGAQREDLLNIFRMRADVKMLESICRLKSYYPHHDALRPEQVFRAQLSSFSQREILEMLQSDTAEDVLKIARKTRYGKYLPQDGVIEWKMRTMELRINERNLRFSTCPQVVLLSFVGILENEMYNITHIIEGIRYKLPPEEMLQYLILPGDAH